MATLEKAKQYATSNVRKYCVRYCIIQVRNGQWMTERVSFVQSAPGRMSYASRMHTALEANQDGTFTPLEVKHGTE